MPIDKLFSFNQLRPEFIRLYFDTFRSAENDREKVSLVIKSEPWRLCQSLFNTMTKVQIWSNYSLVLIGPFVRCDLRIAPAPEVWRWFQSSISFSLALFMFHSSKKSKMLICFSTTPFSFLILGFMMISSSGPAPFLILATSTFSSGDPWDLSSFFFLTGSTGTCLMLDTC